MSRRPASAVDQYVGNRIRVQRQILKMSQQAIGKKLDITFQQVQKYEKGSNRVSVGRLHQICEVLKVPLSFMFEGGPAGSFDSMEAKKAPTADFINDFLATREGIELVKAFKRIQDAELRRRIVKLVTAMADRGS
jgi:transcriptional regulator with XRE-family HTH domain